MKPDVALQVALPDLFREHLPRAHVREWTRLIWAPCSASSRQLRQDLDPAVLPSRLKILSLQVEDAVLIVTVLAITSAPDLALLHAGTEVARPPTCHSRTCWTGCRSSGLVDQTAAPLIA